MLLKTPDAMRYKYLYIILEVLLPLVFLPSCQKGTEFSATQESRFTLVLEEENGAPPTRSILQSADIETKVTSVTLGLYQGGALVEKEYYGSGFDQMVFPLEDGAYTAYALVNMGDMREALPEQEAALESLSYSIPGYLDADIGIEYRGIPMAGSLTYIVGISSSGAIPVRRLMAKVTAQLSCDWTGVITSVKVHNLNRSLKPFGDSAAESVSDILPVYEFQTGGGQASGTYVFYVPENLQGTVPGIADPSEKSPEGNETVNARKDRMTYLETLVTGTSGVEGTILYRSFLGNNATSDFDIHRNWRYTWTLNFLPDGRLNNDWKHENNLTWSEYRYSISPTHLSLYLGETDYVRVYRYEDRYISGIYHASAGPTLTYSQHFSWSYASLDNPSIQNDNAVISGYLYSDAYRVTAKGNGTRRITASGPDGSSAENLTCDVKAMNYRRQLILIADPPRAAVGETIHLRALVYTTQNGITTGGTDVTDNRTACFIYRMGSSYPIQVPYQGIVTATGPGRDHFDAAYRHAADGKMLYAAGEYITFEATHTGNLFITGGTTPGVVGESVQLQASFVLYNNGNIDDIASTSNVTNQVSWKILDGENIGFHVSSAGSVTSSGPGASLVQATYSAPNGLSYETQAIVVFNSH
jgi:hypothetical protein